MTRSKSLLVSTIAGAAACTIAAFTVAACGDRRSTPAADSARPTSTSTSTSSDTVNVQGVWSDRVTAESRYVARYVNGRLVVLEEQMVLADSTTSARRYVYDPDFAPTHLVEHRTLTAASSNSSPTILQSTLNIYLTGDRVDSTSKQVNSLAKAVQPYEIDNMRRHERELLARVPTTLTTPRPNR